MPEISIHSRHINNNNNPNTMSATPAPVPAPAQAPITAAETTKKAAPEFPMDPNAPLFVASAVVASGELTTCLDFGFQLANTS